MGNLYNATEKVNNVVIANALQLEAARRHPSKVDYSISLKFCTEFKHMTPEVS